MAIPKPKDKPKQPNQTNQKQKPNNTQTTNPGAIPIHDQAPLAGGGRKIRINIIKQPRQTDTLCVTFEMQSPEAEEAA